MSPATEIAYFPLRPGVCCSDGHGKQAFDHFFQTVADWPGLQSIYWGSKLEQPKWRDLEDHYAFMKSPYYSTLLNPLRPYLSGEPLSMYHVRFPKPIDDFCSKPVVECVTMYVSHAKAPDYQPNLDKMLEVLSEADGNFGSISGQSVEEAEHETLEEFGGKGARFVALIAWTSIEAHEAFKDHPSFSRNAHLLRDNVKKVEMHHVKLNKFTVT